VTVRNLESRAPEGTWPACCALPQRASVTPSLSLHFSPSPPKKLGHWFELGFYVPPGTHVITSEARWVQGAGFWPGMPLAHAERGPYACRRCEVERSVC
jgi:hypothetical protein